MRRILPTILRGIPGPDETIGPTGRFQLNVIAAAPIPVNRKDWIFLDLNNSDYLGGQTDIQIGAQSVAVNGRSVPGMKAKDLYNILIDILDNHMSIADASFVVEGTPLPSRSLPETREPITPREEQRPIVIVEPEPDPSTGSGSNGNGSNGSQNNGTEEPEPLPFPIGSSSGKIFGIEPKYLLIGGIAAFFLFKGK